MLLYYNIVVFVSGYWGLFSVCISGDIPIMVRINFMRLNLDWSRKQNETFRDNLLVIIRVLFKSIKYQRYSITSATLFYSSMDERVVHNTILMSHLLHRNYAERQDKLFFKKTFFKLWCWLWCQCQVETMKQLSRLENTTFY